MTIEYKTPTLTLKVHENFVLAMANTFVNIAQQEIDFLASVATKHFSGPFAVIEVRDKNISIDPAAHTEVKALLPNLTTYALVTNSTKAIHNFRFEEVFMKYEQHRLCNTMDEAKEWVASVLPA
jgi:hypothetical protein